MYVNPTHTLEKNDHTPLLNTLFAFIFANLFMFFPLQSSFAKIFVCSVPAPVLSAVKTELLKQVQSFNRTLKYYFNLFSFHWAQWIIHFPWACTVLQMPLDDVAASIYREFFPQ